MPSSRRFAALTLIVLSLAGCARPREPWEDAPIVKELGRLDDAYRAEAIAAGKPEKAGPYGYVLDHENESTRKRLIAMTGDGFPRPEPRTNPDAIWLDFWTTKDSGYYDKKFDRLIRELAPHWFK